MTLKQELDLARQENERLKAAIAVQSKPKSLTLKVGEKGGVSVYGLGRFPVTLYKEQWHRLFSHKEDIETFIVTNESRLKSKE